MSEKVIDKVKRFAELRAKRKKLRKQAREVKAEMDKLERKVIDDMTKQGVQSIKVDGNQVYLSTTLRARSKNGDHARAVRTLQEHGLEDLIVLGPQSVSSYLRGFDSPEEIPPHLKEAFEMYEQTSVNVRKA